MRWHIIAAVLTCVLFPSSTIMGLDNFSVPEQIGSLGTSGEERQESSVGTSRVDRAGNFLLKKAEDLAQRAAVLRKKQNAKSLWAATRLFRESSRLFAAGHSYDKAADSHLQIGEIYLILSEFDKARKSFDEASKVAQDPELRCSALSGIARTYATTGPYSLADDYSRQASVCANTLAKGASRSPGSPRRSSPIPAATIRRARTASDVHETSSSQ